MNASITDLSPATEYEVQVRATNGDGDGPWSDEEASIVCRALNYYNSEPIGGRFLKSNFGG